MRILTKLLLGILLSMSTICYAEDAKETKAATTESKMVINTDAFLDKGMLPTLYTCDGKDISPQLSWTGIPTKTKTLALVMQEPNTKDGMFYHWVVYNMPKTIKEISKGAKTPTGAMTGMNSFKKQQYSGPCPPKGTSHQYTFTLFALDNKLTVPKDATGKAVVGAMKNHIVGKIELTTVYSRWIQ